MTTVVACNVGVIKRGSRKRIIYLVPQRIADMFEERTIKVFCWLDMNKPEWLDFENIHIHPLEDDWDCETDFEMKVEIEK